MNLRSLILVPSIAILMLLALVSRAPSQSTAFTYQGSLSDNGAPANGTYDFELRLYDSLSGGNQLGNTVARNGITVIEGVFSVSLDFGDQFPGAARWIEIRVRQGTPPMAKEDQLGGYTILTPRQPVSSTPYAVRSLTAGNADTAATATDATLLGGVDASQYVVTTDPRMTDSRAPTAGSDDYIQNGTAQQASSDFNITGTGKADKFDAATQFDLGGARFLRSDANANTLLGIDTGNSLTTLALFNTFVGFAAGRDTTSGNANTFIGVSAGVNNTIGMHNTFVGQQSGSQTTTGSENSFFGYLSGLMNLGGNSNSFFGNEAGRSTVNGSENSFFGRWSGRGNTGGVANSFFGAYSGESNTIGTSNSFFGYNTGRSNAGGERNSYFGTLAGQNGTVGNNNSFFGFSSGAANSATGNSFFGAGSGESNTTGDDNAFFGLNAGGNNTISSKNS
ncbi:MAG: hypothetical protein OEQ28_06685, partial [Acidobacteriota bacterium]|nr:hypothetical protein [Acidobacteriota bacterium]